jgi:superfamily II DNA or RNA helicase
VGRRVAERADNSRQFSAGDHAPKIVILVGSCLSSFALVPFEEAPMPRFAFDAVRAALPPHDYQAALSLALLRAVETSQPGARLLVHVATGGGKTRIANDVVGASLLPAGKRVLWITKDWNLVAQAAADLAQRFPLSERASFIGTQGRTELSGLREGPVGDIVYTTVQTWNNRIDGELADVRFDVIVVDEVHWGENAACYERLFRRYRRTAVFVGLTATPHEGSSWKRVGRAWTLSDLVEKGILAAPVLAKPLRTRLRWRPERSLAHGDFTPASLRQLATNRKRNALLVETIVARRHVYGQTLVFACNIEHATLLARKLQRAGVSAEAVHSDLPRDAQKEALESFRTSRTQVLVNVAQLTHGVDIPSIRTIVLARPTTSTTLFSQMIGRGTRREADKDTFTLLDCVDELARAEDAVIRAETFCRLQPRGAGGHCAGHAHDHGYERAPIISLPLDAPSEAVRGLDLQPRQTFGLEIELTSRAFEPGVAPADWSRTALALLEAVASVAPAASAIVPDDGFKDNTVWNVEWDASCGWEITSPILVGEAGFEEVVAVTHVLDRAAERLGLRVSKRTGLHVHLATSGKAGVLRRVMEIAAAIEPALLSLVAPSRFDNPFCKPVRRRIAELRELTTLAEWRLAFAEHDTRYIAVNPRNAIVDEGLGTVEIRLHSGTTDASKILPWVSLWMRIVDAAERGFEVSSSLGENERSRATAISSGVDGDIAEACELLGCGRSLIERLVIRREQVVRASWATHPVYGGRAERALAVWARRRLRRSAALGPSRWQIGKGA